jgi:hypothetical protein
MFSLAGCGESSWAAALELAHAAAAVRVAAAPAAQQQRAEVQRCKKLRIVILGFGTARQKMVLERWTNPKPLGTIVDRAAM